MNIDEIKAALEQKMKMALGLKARVKFDFGDKGLILIDSTASPPVISHENGEADVTLICSADTFSAILEGRQDPNMAFMTGKLKVKGSMGLAMKLNAILED